MNTRRGMKLWTKTQYTHIEIILSVGWVVVRN